MVSFHSVTYDVLGVFRVLNLRTDFFYPLRALTINPKTILVNVRVHSRECTGWVRGGGSDLEE